MSTGGGGGGGEQGGAATLRPENASQLRNSSLKLGDFPEMEIDEFYKSCIDLPCCHSNWFVESGSTKNAFPSHTTRQKRPSVYKVYFFSFMLSVMPTEF